MAVPSLLSQINALGQALTEGQVGAREGLLEACAKLTSELSNPAETLIRLTWAEPTHHAVVRLAVELDLFEALVAKKGSPKSSEELASACKPQAETLLVSRMLKHLAALGTVCEVDVDTFAPTPFAKKMTDENFKDTVVFIQDNWNLTHLKAPGFWRERGFKSPTNGADGLFQYAYDVKGEGFFDYCATHPQWGKQFGSMIAAFGEGKPRWFDEHYYPVKERLIEGAKKGEVFLVDVGGGRGHDLEGIRATFGDDLPGKCILQDQADVVEIARLSSGLEAVAHDFNTPQPIKGLLQNCPTAAFLTPLTKTQRSTSLLHPSGPLRLV